MARLEVLKDEALTPEFLTQVKEIESSGGNANFMRVFGHRPDMFGAYLNFYFPSQEGGVLDVTFKEKVRLYIANLNDCYS